MPDEMGTIPPRVNTLEREVHTLKHRMATVEDACKDTPHRLTVLEMAVERLPKIEGQLSSMAARLNQILFTLGGFGLAFTVWQMGPEILKFLGAR